MNAPVITTALPPERLSAVTLFNQGVEAIKANADNTSLAWQLICSSVEHDPTLAVGWQQVSQINWQQKNLTASIAALRRMLELPLGDLPGDMTKLMLVDALGNAGHRLFHAGKVAEAREFTEKALKLAPTEAALWTTMSLIESWSLNHAEAIRCAERAMEIDPDGVNETALAFACLYDRQFARGLKHFEARFKYKLPQFLNYPYPKWTGEDLTGKTLFIVTDQGLGDSISFMRFVPMAAERAGQVLLIVQPELVRFAAACLQDCPNVDVIPSNTPFPVADYWTTPMSLPVPLGLTDQQIIEAPNLRVPQFYSVPRWKSEGRKLHIGICWAGSDIQDIERWRRMTVDHFLELYRVPGIQLYSLQKGPRAQDLHTSGAVTLIKDLGPYINDVADTVSIMRHLDLVITIETSVGHMCGVADVPCWVFCSRHGADFRIGRSGEKPLWYPNHRLFRQSDDGQWGPVVEQVVEVLREKVNVRRT